MQVKGRQAPSWAAANAPDQGGGADSQPGSHRGGGERRGAGPLSEMLGLMATSPLARMTGQRPGPGQRHGQCRSATAAEPAHQRDRQIQGAGQRDAGGQRGAHHPDTPALGRARGVVQFSDTGFTLSGVQARALGGDVRLEGGMRALPAGGAAVGGRHPAARAGRGHSPGLQQTLRWGLCRNWRKTPPAARPHSLALSFRRGARAAGQHHPAGHGAGPACALGKTADAQQPLRYEQMVARESLVPVAAGATPPPLRDQVTLDLGSIGSATYLRDLAGAQPRCCAARWAWACRPVNLRRWWPRRGCQHPAGPGGCGCVGASVEPVHPRTRQCCRWGCWRCTPRRHRRDGPRPGSVAGHGLPAQRGGPAPPSCRPRPAPCTTWWPVGCAKATCGVPTWTPLNSTAMWSFASPHRATWAMAACLRACRA